MTPKQCANDYYRAQKSVLSKDPIVQTLDCRWAVLGPGLDHYVCEGCASKTEAIFFYWAYQCGVFAISSRF